MCEKLLYWVETHHIGGASRPPALVRTVIFLSLNLSLTAKGCNPRHREANMKTENKESKKLTT